MFTSADATNSLLKTIDVDLLAVRRIPLRRHPYIAVDGDDPGADAGSSSERTKPDPAAAELMREMQRIVATDRDLHEKVS